MKTLEILVKSAIANWKTSGAGIIAAAIALLVYYQVLTPQGAGLWAGFALLLLGLVSKDGDAPSVQKPKV
jgi:hypothetical protein